MSFEHYAPIEEPVAKAVEQHEAVEHKETPKRFRGIIEAWLKANYSKIEVKGEENLDLLPPGAKVIFATTHISDFDVLMPIATLGDRFKMKAVNASVQHEITGDTLANLSMRLAGKENTIPVDFKFGEHPQAGKSYYSKAFNPDNFIPMKQALEEGDAIVIAGENPNQVKDGKLSDRGGYGAVYLAEITGAVIVPISVDIKSEDPDMGTSKSPLKTLLNRPEVLMVIGKPLTLSKIPDIESMALLMKEHGSTEKTPDALSKLRRITKDVRAQSDVVMRALAENLPESKRGVWK